MNNLSDPVVIREVGLRDGLQSIARVAAHGAEAGVDPRRLRRRPARDRGRLVRSARACCRSSPTPPNWSPSRRRCPACACRCSCPISRARSARIECGADLMLLPLSASHAHSLANLRKTPDDVVQEIARIRAARDAAGSQLPDRSRHQHRVRLHDPGPRRARRSAALAQGRARRRRRSRGPRRHRRLCRSARWCATCSSSAIAVAGDRLACGHFHDTRGLGHGQRLRGVAGGHRAASTRASPASAAARTRRARAATSRPRTSPISSPAWASRPARISIA